MSDEVTVVDRGLKAMLRRMKKFDGASVTVGVQGSEAGTSRGPGFNQASLAAVHEFGSADGRIPQRSFIRGTVDREKSLINKMLTKAAKEGVVNGRLKVLLGEVGEKIVSEMKRTITSSIGIRANKSSTISAKGSSTPLIDTGALKNAITFKVHGA